MTTEMQKLAAKLKCAPCPHCGVRHAGKHNDAAKTAAISPEAQRAYLQHLQTMLQGARGAAPEAQALMHNTVRQKLDALHRAQAPAPAPTRAPVMALSDIPHVPAHLTGLVGEAQEPATQSMRALKQKLARYNVQSPAAHAQQAAWAAHQAPVSTQMPMRMSPQDALARQQMLQNPQMFAGGTGAPSGLELARPAQPTMKRSSEIEKLRDTLKQAGFMGTMGKGLGVAGKALGFLPSGVGNVAGAAVGALGGAMAAPPGQRLRGAAAGSLSGLPGAAGFIAPTLAGKALGV